MAETASNAPRPSKPAKRSFHGRGGGFRPGEKPKDFKGTFRKLLKLLGIFKVALIIVVIFSIASTVFNVIGPKVLSLATTELFNGSLAKLNGTGGIDFTLVSQILLMTIVLYVGSSICGVVQGWLMAGVAQKVTYELRKQISEKINRMPFAYFDDSSIGDTLSRITNDVDTLGQNLSNGVVQVLTSVITIIGVVIMMLMINPIMTVIALLIAPFSLVIMIAIIKISQKHYDTQQATLGEINGIVEETFSGHAVVKAFNQEDATIQMFDETNEKLYNAGWKSSYITSFTKPMMDFVNNAGYVAVAVVGGYFAIVGSITVGDIQAFIQYVSNFTRPLTQLAQIMNTFQQMAAAAERIFEFLAEDEEPREEGKPPFDVDDYSIDFKHVRFGYEPNKPIIKDFTAHIESGQTVAIVGPTGAGKTTLVKLLMRFYEVQSGSIEVGGRNIADFTRNDVRSQFGMVLQDTWLFNDTIRENIRYGRMDATDEEVEAAAKAGLADHFIRALPKGYDFEINEDGGNISQGQRQLLTIARAILADRRMLILDEATSSVDTRTEERIQQAMDALMVGRTSFVIAHRLSTIRDADLILVMKDGDIVEQGTHAELLELNGFYAELYNSQFELA